MNWDAIGAIGELLGALVVLVTLIYLAVQVRHSRDLLEDNKKIATSQAAADLMSRFESINLTVARDPELASLMLKLTDSASSLTPVETTRANALARTWTNSWIAIEEAYLNDQIPEAMFGFLRTNCQYLVRNHVLLRPYWEELIESDLQHYKFVEDIKNALEHGSETEQYT